LEPAKFAHEVAILEEYLFLMFLINFTVTRTSLAFDFFHILTDELNNLTFGALVNILLENVPLSFIFAVDAEDGLFIFNALYITAPRAANTPWAFCIVRRLSIFDVTVLVAFATLGTVLPEVRAIHVTALALGKVSIVLKSCRLDAEGTEEFECVQRGKFPIHHFVLIDTKLAFCFQLCC
jgi:hypothetical protein